MNRIRWKLLAVLLSVILLIPVFSLYAATTGKIAGVVKDKATKETLAGVNIVVVGTVMGASSGVGGNYFILNVPPGKYSLKASMVGYKSVSVENLIVYIDLTTTINFELEVAPVAVEGVTVIAERPLVEPTRTATTTTVTGSEVIPLAATSISDLSETFAGVFQGTIRGARPQDNVTLIDGSPTTRLWTNVGDAFGVNPYMLEEMDLVAGTFNAEYGDALAGFTNIVTKEGGKKVSGNVRFQVVPSGLDHVEPPEVTITYPDGTTKTVDRSNIYWDYDQPSLSGASYKTDSKVAQGHFKPTDYSDYLKNNKTDKPTWLVDWGLGGPLTDKLTWFGAGRVYESWGRYPNEYTKLWNVFGKLAFRPTNNIKVVLSGFVEDQGWFSGKGQQYFNWQWKYNLNNYNKGYPGSYMWGVEWTHTLKPSMFYEAKIGQFADLYKEYNPKFADLYKDWKKGDGWVKPPVDRRIGQVLNQSGYLIDGDATSQSESGMPLLDYRTMKATEIKASITNQVNINHQLKGGVDITLYSLFRHREEILRGIFDNSHGDEWDVTPKDISLYAQDRIELGSLILNVGLRLDAFDPGTEGWNYWQPVDSTANRATGVNTLTEQSKSLKMKYRLCPRLGVSHPITDKAALHYAYGIFARRPAIYELYNNLHSDDTHDAGLGNPDLKLEKTSAYEMGVQVEPIPDYVLDVTAYSRDMSDLVTSANFDWNRKFGGYYNTVSYRISALYGDSRGIEFTLKKRMKSHWEFRGAYTLAWAQLATASFSPINVASVDITKPNLSKEDFASWDRRHKVDAVLILDLPYQVGVSAILGAESGVPYRSTEDVTTDPFNRKRKMSRLPWTKTLGLKAEKAITFIGITPSVYVDVRNALNWTNIIGSPDSDWYRTHKEDPTGSSGYPGVYGPPRDVYVGMSLNF